MKSSLKSPLWCRKREVALCVASAWGFGVCWVFSLENTGVQTTPRLMGRYLKGIGTDRVMYGGRKLLMQSMLCQICLKLFSLLWKEKQWRQSADLCEAHSSSKKMYLVFLSCYYSLSRNCTFQVEQVLASRNSCTYKWLKDVVRNPLHLSPKHYLVVTI